MERLAQACATQRVRQLIERAGPVMDNMALILVHGAAGRVPATKWLDQINAGMREVGGPSIEDHDTVACAEYELELRNPAAMTLPRVRGCADLLGAETQYATQQAELAEAVRPFQSPSRWQTTALAELSWAKPLGFRQARTRLPLRLIAKEGVFGF